MSTTKMLSSGPTTPLANSSLVAIGFSPALCADVSMRFFAWKRVINVCSFHKVSKLYVRMLNGPRPNSPTWPKEVASWLRVSWDTREVVAKEVGNESSHKAKCHPQ